MRRSDAIRAEVLTRFGKLATDSFAEDPTCNSVMMLVAQYWCDEAADHTHDMYLKSTRAVPLWPNQPPGTYEETIEVEGEGFATGIAVDDRDLVIGFAPYCPEDGSQEENECYNYRPYAIARRGEGVEIVGEARRPWATVYGVSRNPDEEFPDDGHYEEGDFDDADMDGDERGEQYVAAPEGAGAPPAVAAIADAGERFVQLLATRGEPDAYRVIADFLQERSDPRGDLVALALADPAAYDQRLLAHRASWLGELAQFAASSRFDRGILEEIELYGELTASAIDSPLWASITHVRVSPASIGGVIACDRRVTHLTLTDANEDAIAQLIASDALPALTSLQIVGEMDFHLDAFKVAPGRAGLRELVLDEDEPDLGAWYAQVPELGLGRLTIVAGGCWGFTFLPGGRVEVAQASFEPGATLDKLVEILATWDDKRPPIHAVRSRCWDPDDAIRAAIAERGGDVR